MQRNKPIGVLRGESGGIERGTPPITNLDDKVWITVTYTINLGNFENVKIEAGFSQTMTLNTPQSHIDRMADDTLETVVKKGEQWREKLKPTLKPFRNPNT